MFHLGVICEDNLKKILVAIDGNWDNNWDGNWKAG
jgi:hypothetical protein